MAFMNSYGFILGYMHVNMFICVLICLYMLLIIMLTFVNRVPGVCWRKIHVVQKDKTEEGVISMPRCQLIEVIYHFLSMDDSKKRRPKKRLPFAVTLGLATFFVLLFFVTFNHIRTEESDATILVTHTDKKPTSFDVLASTAMRSASSLPSIFA